MARIGEFSKSTKLDALERQGNCCASCGTPIVQLGQAGREEHEFGEGAQAHHMNPLKSGDQDNSLENCVVLCESCHYTAHEGGNYRYGTVVAQEYEFPFFRRQPRKTDS